MSARVQSNLMKTKTGSLLILLCAWFVIWVASVTISITGNLVATVAISFIFLNFNKRLLYCLTLLLSLSVDLIPAIYSDLGLGTSPFAFLKPMAVSLIFWLFAGLFWRMIMVKIIPDPMDLPFWRGGGSGPPFR